MPKPGLVQDAAYLEHETGEHPERAARLTAIGEALERYGYRRRMQELAACPLPEDDLLLVHREQYVRALRECASQGGGMWDPDTVVSPASYRVALLAAGGVWEAARRCLEGEVEGALALVRPPGHHAEPDRGMGFCLFNNVALAARLALRQGLERVLIVDWDVHHGNGTQAAFYDEPQVLYFSTHQMPLYPGTGVARETGRGAGAGYNANVPLPPGTGDRGYQMAFRQVLLPLAQQFRPELILVSAGFDGHYADPLANMLLTVAGFRGLSSLVRELADRFCPGRLVLALEGGYNLQVLGEAVAASLEGMANWEAQATDPLPAPSRPEVLGGAQERVQVARKALGQYWQLEA